MKRQLLARTLDSSGARALLARLWPQNGIVCLNYHRIADHPLAVGDPGVVSTDAAGFESHMQFLARHCDVIVPDEIPIARSNPRGRHALVTFDDGYRDNYEVAFPTLRRHGLRACFFVATGYLDHPRLTWWDEIATIVALSTDARIELREFGAEPLALATDRDAARRALLALYKSLPSDASGRLLERVRSLVPAGRLPEPALLWMNWDMLREMAAAGMAIGGHTVDHPVLARLPLQAQRDEIERCAVRLRAELGRPMEYFAYPVGARDSFDEATRACLRSLGIRYAFSYYGGFSANERADDLDVVREPISPAVDISLFRSIATLPRLFCRA